MICCVQQISALPVELNIAQQAALNFYKSKHPDADKNSSVFVSSVYTDYFSQDNSVLFYAINFSDTGFVLIAGDDAVSPVLGYSYSSFFSGTDIPVQLAGLLEEYRNLISHVRSYESDLTVFKAAEWNSLLNDNFTKSTNAIVDPLLFCRWDQGARYNSLCPQDPDGPGGHVYAGCVATAMSMVMYHFRYPTSGQGQNGYWSDYGYLDVDFSQSSYVWNNMPVSLSSHNYQVAKLMYDAGVAVDMMYSPNGSGAYMNDAAYAMHAYFRYSPTLTLESRNSYSLNQWVNLLRSQLDQGYPLIYAGYGSNGPGHAFVCDGYDNGNLFHFNWGWSGSYNGFYMMDYLTPGGYNFSSYQMAIINCFPADNNYPYGCQSTTTITGSGGSITDDSGPFNYNNNSNCSWLIQPDVLSESVTLKFLQLNTEQGQDQICAYNGPDSSFPLLGCFSGSALPSSIVADNGTMFITFQTNATTTDKGFFAEFSSVPEKFCDNYTILTSPFGTIEDGSNSFPYQPNTLCRWLINPPEGNVIIFEFEEFDTEQDKDLVILLDNSTFPSTEIVRFSGSQIPPAFTYYGNPIVLMFKTDDYTQHSGWKISYTSSSTSVNENENQSFSVFPNPFAEFIQLSNMHDGSLIKLFDPSGREIFRLQAESHSNSLIIETADLPSGMYLLQISSENGTNTEKIIKL